jgi:excisionase family DNA binding protein
MSHDLHTPRGLLLRPQELADALDVTRDTILRWCREGRLRHVKFGGTVRIPREELNRIIEGGTR